MPSGLLHLALRFRRSLAMLLGAHVLVTAVITALAACNPTADRGSAVQGADAQAVHHEAHRAVHHSASHSPHQSPAKTHHHGTAPLACPMAMACAVSAIVTGVPMLPTHATQMASTLAFENDHLPRSTRLAPEPPPPRA
ncbi:hypothetical protein [Gemmatimonas aurantiaca]|uniref:hypothetical protein n=1 Tax=Gemmatimonas aurantiaca TaxID=173480 RepID=UPI00301B7A10